MQGSRAAQTANYTSSVHWARHFNAVKGEPLTTWISTFRSKMACVMVEYIAGTFNLNCRIRFSDDVEWMVRFPVSGRAMGDVDAKVRHEVAVMKLIRSRTSVPVPGVIAWGSSHACPLNLGPFIIMQFVEGRVLGRLVEVPGHLPNGKILKDNIDRPILEHIYRQIAKFILDIAEIEFPSIGTIAQGNDQFGVESGPVSVKMNDIERQDGISPKASTKPFQTTVEFFDHLLSLEMEHLRIHPGSVTDAEDAAKKYRRLRMLANMVPELVDPAWDGGPFVLRCEGMRFGNMLVDEDFNITAVLDWEWSYSAPRQLLHSPPRWLIVRRPLHWNTRAPWGDSCSARYHECFEIFIRILAEEENIRAKERSPGKNGKNGDRLSHLMSNSLESGIFWLHELLLAPSAHSNEALWEKVEKSVMKGTECPSVNDEEVQEFVNWKVRQLRRFNELKSGQAEAADHPHEGLLSIGIQEILNTC